MNQTDHNVTTALKSTNIAISNTTTRKQLLNHIKNDAYETRDEEGKTIENPEMVKEHIADYFENLYQATEGEKSHEE